MSAFSHKLGQVTYPRMERQDLTQSQLGSFKFTPTDEVRHVFAKPPPSLAQQFIHLSAKHANSGKPLSRLSTALPGNGYSNHRSPDSAASPTRFDSAFFDTYIKPDLAKSRLVLGPTALRAAVDGSPTSPQRLSTIMDSDIYHHAYSADSTQPTTSAGQTTPYLQSQNQGSSTASAVPGTIQSDVDFLHTSLIRALASEQQAHQLTKDALEAERKQRLRVEADAQRIAEHNRSLIGSVNMLKSVVQHTMKKEQQASERAEYERFHASVKAAGPTRTILYDAAEQLKKQAAAKAASHKAAENHQLFDFDLLERHRSPALREHFSNPTENTTDDDTNLINITPEKADRCDKLGDTWKKGETAVKETAQAPDNDDLAVILKDKPRNQSKPAIDPYEKTMAMPFDAPVQWNQEPVFEDEHDRFNRLGYQKSIFAAHPVRYMPKKSDKNLYRTVMIDFIPKDTTCKDVLACVRGGAVESIQMCGPIGHSTDFMTARIVFTYELGARGVYLRGQTPGIKIKGKKVRVWQILEPTYPRAAELEKEIFDDGFTRMLLIQDAIDASLDKLPQKLEHQISAGFVLEIGKAYDGLPMVEFTSIAECSKALKQLLNDPDFGGSQFDFEQDPCTDPY